MGRSRKMDDYERGFDDGFASADDWYAANDDETLASHGLMRIPKDRNGAPICVGDRVIVGGVKLGTVRGFSITVCVSDDGHEYSYKPSKLMHVGGDSIGHVLDDLRAYVGKCDGFVSKEALSDFQKRLRKLEGDADADE